VDNGVGAGLLHPAHQHFHTCVARCTIAIQNHAQANRGDFQAILNMWSGRPDPDQNLSIWLACDGLLNRGQYCSPDLDRVLTQLAQNRPLETFESKA
jgi:ABC-type oligopeptide transport system substrate-binding subunit